MTIISTGRFGRPSLEDGLIPYALGGIERMILGTGSKFRPGPLNWRRIGDKESIIDWNYGSLLRVAQEVPHLNVVISQGADMFSNMEIKHFNKAGEEIEDSPVLKLLNNPNPLQSGGDYQYEYYCNHAVYRINFIYNNFALPGLSELPAVLWTLPPGEMKVKMTGKLYRQHTIDQIIENYTLTGDSTPFTPAEIIMVAEGMKSNGIIPASRIESLLLPLSNIMAALKSNNIIIKERGLIGMISADASARDEDGAKPFDEKERQRAENDYQKKYSLDSPRGHVTFTSANIKWVPMTFDVSQLMLFEGLEDSFASICASLRIDRDVFPSVKGATFENKKQGTIITYQNTMLPLAQKFCDAHAQKWGLDKKSERLVASYDHLPIMQEDAQKKAAARKSAADTVAVLIDKNAINPKQGAAIIQAISDIRIDDTLANNDPILATLSEMSPLTSNTMIGALPVDTILQMLGQPPLPNGAGKVPLRLLVAPKPQGNENQNSQTG